MKKNILHRSLSNGIGGGSDSGNFVINIDNYLTIEALEDGLTAKLSNNACEYCIDGDGVWKTLAVNTTTPSINQGQIISFRGNLTPNSSNGIGTFTISKKCNIKGNCISMLFGDDAENNYSLSGKNYTFYKMFYNCTNIIEVSPNFLTATTLAYYCYYNMFYGCTSLTTTPELPATTLANYCYYSMFQGCTSLTTAPSILPATTLANYCYQSMFSGCTSLTTAPELPATTLAVSCYFGMFNGCKSLTMAPELPATTLAKSCYYYMFYGCTSIITTPELPATTLADNCYQSMFSGCTSLTTATELPSTKLSDYCYDNMFYKCTSLTTAPELPATTLAEYCYSSMFNYCTSLTTAPDLPATTLANYCYSSMFSNTNVLPDCNNINFSSYSVVSSGGLKGLFCGTKVTDDDLRNILPINPLTGNYYLPVTTLSNSCYDLMFENCKSLTKAPDLPATTLVRNCYRNMFFGCSKLNHIKAMFTTTPSSSYTNNWVWGVSSAGTFVKNENATWNVTGNYGIPSGWTVLTA